MNRGMKFAAMSALTCILTLCGAAVAFAVEESPATMQDFTENGYSYSSAPTWDYSNSFDTQNIAYSGTAYAQSSGIIGDGWSYPSAPVYQNINETPQVNPVNNESKSYNEKASVSNDGCVSVSKADDDIIAKTVKISGGIGTNINIRVSSVYNGIRLKLVGLNDEDISEIIKTAITNEAPKIENISLSQTSTQSLFPWSTAGPEQSAEPEPSAQPTEKPEKTTVPTATVKPSNSNGENKTPQQSVKPSADHVSDTTAKQQTIQPQVTDSAKGESAKQPATTASAKDDVPKTSQETKTENKSENTSKVTKTDVPKTDDTTDSYIPYLVCLGVSTCAIIYGMSILFKPVTRKKCNDD